ncbi:DUF6491 family protein [Pseudomonas schmalbachii]|uniref:Lipoprotein n=1 Tax=Pseudomonas schmalbachii TaxID=2816993 RepID=A0ABS3TMM7_9PSED|nr:DUF6491 family protein [Pseudomonas schmalbachii]MBO3274908.1 hypothetical protein [Pseudomonas schmalbachii]
MQRIPSLFLPLAALPLLASCSHVLSPEESPPLDEQLAQLGYRQGEEVQVVPHLSIDSWRLVDSRHIAMGLQQQDAYLAELNVNCYRLDNQDFVTTATTAGWLARLDKVYGMEFGGKRADCLFKRFHRLERGQLSMQ